MESANLDALLTMDTLSQLLSAQNFNMPAGYIKNEDESQVLVKVGDEFSAIDEVEDMVLCKVDKVGDVRISDVADVTVIDNADDNYAKINGNDGVILSISKSSTAGTSDVSKACNKAIKELEEKYDGLHITPLMDQGGGLYQADHRFRIVQPDLGCTACDPCTGDFLKRLQADSCRGIQYSDECTLCGRADVFYEYHIEYDLLIRSGTRCRYAGR